jgi:hypothetical protein
MAYAAETEVTVEKSRAEIERLCMKYGCSQFMSGIDFDKLSARVQFKAKNRIIRFDLPIPDRKKFHQQKKFEQASRTRWRALVLVLKAKLESVESGISTFEEEFLPFIVMPNDQTVASILLPMINGAYETGKMPTQLLIGNGEE